MGESIMEGTILKWLKKPGDKIERDEPILEISTDKVDTEIPSPETGVLTEILFKEGDVVEIGKVLAHMSTNGDTSAEPQKNLLKEEIAAEKEKPKVSDTPKTKEVTAKQVETVVNKEEPVNKAELSKDEPVVKSEMSKEETGFYSPLVLNIAKQENISVSELSKIKGSGLNNRVTKKDLLDYIQNKNKFKPGESNVSASETLKKPVELAKQNIDFDEEGLSVLEFDNVRQKMAEHMVASASISPHVNAIAEVDLSKIEKARDKMKVEFEQNEGFKLTYMPFIVEAAIKALKDFPLVNSIIDDSTVPFKAISRSKINLGIAVAMENGGLIVPVIHNADGKNLTGLARDMYDLGKRARIKKLTLDEIQGGTFTISNYGVFGNIIGTMIINQPQVAILGVGAVKKRPAVLETTEGDFVVIRPMVYLTLSFDHRLVDGALGGKFIMRVAHYLENYQIPS